MIFRQFNNFQSCQKQCAGLGKMILTAVSRLVSRKEIKLRGQAFSTVRWMANARKNGNSFPTTNALIPHPSIPRQRQTLAVSTLCLLGVISFVRNYWKAPSPLVPGVTSHQHSSPVQSAHTNNHQTHIGAKSITSSQHDHLPESSSKARIPVYTSSPAPKTAIGPRPLVQLLNQHIQSGSSTQTSFTTNTTQQPRVQ